MDLLDLREDFIRISGRSELTTAEVDRYINRGQKFLDQRTDFKHGIARFFKKISLGEFSVVFSSQCRVIQEVTVNDTEERTRLTKLSWEDFKTLYTQMPSMADQGVPTVYTPAMLRTYPDVQTLAEMQQYLGFFDAVLGSDYAYNGIIFMPPADQEYVIEVRGRFFSTDLSATNLSSWWMENQYSALLHGALYQLEVDYRNTEGSNDWLASVVLDLQEASKDYAEEEAADIRAWESEL